MEKLLQIIKNNRFIFIKPFAYIIENKFNYKFTDNNKLLFIFITFVYAYIFFIFIQDKIKNFN